MFSHVMVGANDLEASRKFYDAVFATLGIAPGAINRDIRYFYRTPTGVFSFTLPIDNKTATQRMAVRSDLQRNRQTRSTRFTLLLLRMAVQPVKILLAIAKALPENCIWPMCVIQSATSFVRC
jgi:hypothetical protein